MKSLVPILFVTLIAWMGGGTWFWVCKVKLLCDEAEQEMAAITAPAAAPVEPEVTVPKFPFTITYQDSFFDEADATLKFPKMSMKGLVPAQVEEKLRKMVSFMQANPKVDLEITGLYGTKED
ncbi:MAG: hypothetical protein AAGI38_19750, partial [Bacteroidota bacterium]